MLDLGNWRWRIQNLYSCKREGSGDPIPFRMRPEQDEVLTHLYDHRDEMAVIVKSRRLGLSTGIGIGMTDYCTWNGGSNGRLIERSKEFAGEKMNNIMRFSFLSMPPEIQERINIRHKESPSILDPLIVGLDEKMRSEILAGVAARGGDCSFLHVSEMGKIAHTDPKRAEEIRTGALPAARKGMRVIETTWEGGKGGHLWDIIRPALELDADSKVRVFFFPWYGDSQCELFDGVPISKEIEEYFRGLEEKLGRKFRPEQKRWYAVTSKEQGIFMKREYPSTLDEAFSAPVEGAIYADILDALRVQGAISKRPCDNSALVNTCWDLGSPLNTVTWYFQIVAQEIRVIDCDIGLDVTPVERAAHMLAKGYPLGRHYLPHDAMATNTSGKTFHGELTGAGIANVQCVPRTHDIWVGINRLRQLLPRFTFRLPACEDGLNALAAYHYKPDTSTGRASNEPVHDWSSHPSDALRILAEAEMAGMLKTGHSTAFPREPIVVRTGIRDHGGRGVRVRR